MNQFKTRKQKLNYLRRVLAGQADLNELASLKGYFFMLTNEPDVYYSCDPLELGWPPVPINGKIERFSKADIEKFKRPNRLCGTVVFQPDRRPPFPNVDENGRLIKPAVTDQPCVGS